MTKGLPSTPKTQGVTAPVVPLYGHLYETRHGPFVGPRILWEGGATPEGAAATETPSATPAAAPATDDSRLTRALEGLLNQRRHDGDPSAVALTLLRENHDYREQLRTLQGRVPAEGSVTLTPEQAQQWQAYRELSDDPAALRTRLEQGSQAQERELAQVSGANPEILSDLLRVTGLRAEVREVAAQGTQPARREVHLLNAEGQDQGELRAYVQEHRAAYVPALFPAQGAGQQSGTVVNPQAGASAGASAGDSNPLAAAYNGGTTTRSTAQVVRPSAPIPTTR